MNNKDFLKGMIAYKIISDSKNKNNRSGGSSSSGCGGVILIAVIVIAVSALIGSCISGKKTSNYSSTSPRYSGDCLVSGCLNKKMSGSLYCSRHTCHEFGCYNKAYVGGYCSLHQPKTTEATRTTKPATTRSTTRSTEKKDPYNISSYSDIDDFYDDWYDDFDGFDDVEMYWDDHH